MSYKSVSQEFCNVEECPTRVSHKTFRKEFPTRLSDKSVLQECPTKVFRKSVPKESPTILSHKSVIQEFPTRVSHKSVPQKWQLVARSWQPGQATSGKRLLVRGNFSCGLRTAFGSAHVVQYTCNAGSRLWELGLRTGHLVVQM